MRDEALKEQSEISKEKLALAAEKARLEATISLQSDPDKPNLHPMDLMKVIFYQIFFYNELKYYLFFPFNGCNIFCDCCLYTL